MSQERIAIVTGVSRGLGEALAVDLLARGWRVLGLSRHDSPRAAHARYRFVTFDFADAHEVDARLLPVFRELAGESPRAAVLVNNAAAAGPVGVFGRLASAEIADALAVNLAAPSALANLFCRTFTSDACDRRIINVSSGAAERTLAGGGMYCVAKAGLEMLTRSLVAEHPALRAITLRPGIIDTEMQAFMRSQSPEFVPSVSLFEGFHASGQLVPAATVAKKTIDRLIEQDVEPGKTYSYAQL
jgi:NAD(P)-dependent dehydrogenase (short-subunit alcohol dehydrogenase family)